MRYSLRLPLLLLLCGFVTYGNTARAELVPELKITSDYFPTLAYDVGFDLEPGSHVIRRVYFNQEGEAPVFYSLDELQSDSVTVFRKWSFNFVKLQIVRMDSPTSGILELSFLKYAIFGSRSTIDYRVELDPESGQYRITDERLHCRMSEAVVRTNYKAGVPVGIRDIEPKCIDAFLAQ